jgi:hypothetical protein
LRPKNSLSDLERDLLEGMVSTHDMALKSVARFNTFDKMGFGYIDARKKDLGYGVDLRE